MTDHRGHQSPLYAVDYREKYEQKQAECNLVVGVLAGLVAGLFWEAIRR